MPPHSMRGQLFCCPHFLPAVAVSTTNYQQLLAPPVPRSRCNHCSFWLKRLASAVQLRPWPPHFKELSGIASYPPSPLSVRYFSTRSGSVPGYDDGEGLKLELPLAQSAFSPLLSAA